MKVFITQWRTYEPAGTGSEVYLPDEPTRFCYCLEDVGRPTGVKFKGETCIPEGLYRVVITHSTRWNKPMLQIYNEKDGLLVQRHGVTFSGVRIHGGNTIEDTLGCPLYNFNFDEENMRAWGRASDKLLTWVENQESQGNEVYLSIVS